MSQEPVLDNVTALRPAPRIVTRDAHCISRRDIAEPALRVLYRLKSAGFKAHLVGGGVRDLLLGLRPKDFDVATDALPEQVRELFRNCRLIGRRFRLAHVYFGDQVIEVATFRGHGDSVEDDDGDRLIEAGRIVRDNIYGDIDADVWRRDFTANALYYNIEDFSVVDYVGGVRDIEARTLRLIGDPVARYREDPVRMLRAVRFAAKLGFTIAPPTAAPISELAGLLEQIPGARLFEEVLKLFLSGCGLAALRGLREHGLFRVLFPQVAASMERNPGGTAERMLERALEATDQRIADSKPVNPAYLFAAFLWVPMGERRVDFLAHGLSDFEALQRAADAVISQEVGHVSLPRRFTQVTREIWALQPRFERRGGNRAERLLAHPRFRAAYDFLLLRAEAGEDVSELAQWWTDFQSADSAAQSSMQSEVAAAPARGPKRRRRRRARRAPRPESG